MATINRLRASLFTLNRSLSRKYLFFGSEFPDWCAQNKGPLESCVDGCLFSTGATQTIHASVCSSPLQVSDKQWRLFARCGPTVTHGVGS